MTDLKTLREAAALMRERAAAATAGPWLADVLGSEGYAVREVEPSTHPRRRVQVARCGHEDWDTDKANAEHVASWPPAVALAVADWLDLMADDFAPYWNEPYAAPFVPVIEKAYRVARAYLGRDA